MCVSKRPQQPGIILGKYSREANIWDTLGGVTDERTNEKMDSIVVYSLPRFATRINKYYVIFIHSDMQLRICLFVEMTQKNVFSSVDCWWL